MFHLWPDSYIITNNSLAVRMIAIYFLCKISNTQDISYSKLYTKLVTSHMFSDHNKYMILELIYKGPHRDLRDLLCLLYVIGYEFVLRSSHFFLTLLLMQKKSFY